MSKRKTSVTKQGAKPRTKPSTKPGKGAPAAEPRDDIVVLVLRRPALEPEPRGWWRRFPDQAGARERG